jgi:hypothetical protein
MSTKPFDLQKALAGVPVWHRGRGRYVKNVAQIGNRVAFQLEEDGSWKCVSSENV